MYAGDERVGQYHDERYSAKLPPVSPRGPQTGYSPSMMYRYPPTTQPMQNQRQLQSVVTTSFSVEEERDDFSRNPTVVNRSPMEHRQGAIRHDEAASRGGWVNTPEQRQEFSSPAQIPPSPRTASMTGRPPFLHRAYSSPEYYGQSDSMKRSFFHHSRPGDSLSNQLPADFMPPKRAKVTPPSKKEMMVSPQQAQQDPFRRAPSWDVESTEGRYYHTAGRTQSFPNPPVWGQHQLQQQAPIPVAHGKDGHHFSPKAHQQVSPLSDNESPRGSWSHEPISPWELPSAQAQRFWTSPSHAQQSRDEYGSERARSGDREDEFVRGGKKIQRQVTFERAFESAGYRNQLPRDKLQMVADAAAASAYHDDAAGVGRAGPGQQHLLSEESPVRTTAGSPGEAIIMLALPQDKISLSETLCVVRENIEVFTANQDDVDAPAPGRKHAVVVGQVGLRCIHCRHTTRSSDRVKRAVCYPSSIKRIYRTVIDMKLDHFLHCKFVPGELKDRLNELKAVQTRSTGTTMQYFIRAAHVLGMVDGEAGVRLNAAATSHLESFHSQSALLSPGRKERLSPSPPRVITTTPVRETHSTGSSTASWEHSPAQRSDSMSSVDSFDTNTTPEYTPLTEFFGGRIPLALSDDKAALSPLRCFLREQVCAFSATEEDIAVRAPTTFSISVGQVGVGCIHCVKQPSKLRSNRAACFPFSIGRIYQSVADIQRFHFGECKMLPPDVKAKFLSLQSASSKGSKGLATRQYWISSAKKIGLVDSPRGIRFGRDPCKPVVSKALSLDILAQVAFSVTTASKQLVLQEDKPCIAGFLYEVMEQLQPCRFTEADRNKRRLKDVGCIGVECKHCAGQVDSRKFFWSSVSAVESNFVSVHTHMLECRMVPSSMKERLVELKSVRKEQTAALRTGSQKAFFARVWQRLHDEEAASSSLSTRSESFSAPRENKFVEGVNNDMQNMHVTSV